MSLFQLKNVILKSLFKKPVTISYPLSPAPKKERTRGHIEINIDVCIFCGICSKKCPTGAITVTRASNEWEIQRFSCIQCNCCVENCPKKCLNMSNEQISASHKKKTDKYQGQLSEANQE